MEDINFLKSSSKKSAKSSKSGVDYTDPEKDKKPKKKKQPKVKKKGFFSNFFGTKKDKPPKKEKPIKSAEKIKAKKPSKLKADFTKSAPEKPKKIKKTEEPKVLSDSDRTEGTEVILPPLKPEEKLIIDKFTKSAPKEPVSVKESPKPKPVLKPEPLPPLPPKKTKKTKGPKQEELEQTVEKIKNGEIPIEALDVNLIPKDLLHELKPERKFINLFWIGLATCLVVLIVYGALFYMQSFYLKQTEVNHQKIEELEDEIVAYTPLKEQVDKYNTQINDINSLLERHIYWNVFFQLLEENILPEVILTNITGSVDGPFTLTAQAPDYKTITSQVAVFEQADNFINKVEVSSATATLEEEEMSHVTFSATIHVVPEIFIRTTNYGGQN